MGNNLRHCQETNQNEHEICKIESQVRTRAMHTQKSPQIQKSLQTQKSLNPKLYTRRLPGL